MKSVALWAYVHMTQTLHVCICMLYMPTDAYSAYINPQNHPNVGMKLEDRYRFCFRPRQNMQRPDGRGLETVLFSWRSLLR